MGRFEVKDVADVENAQGNFAAAETRYREVLRTRRVVLGEQHPDTTKTLLALSGRFGRQMSAVRGAEWKAFEPLSATRGELASIIKLYQDQFGPSGMTVLEGTEAREERFLRRSGASSIRTCCDTWFLCSIFTPIRTADQ